MSNSVINASIDHEFDLAHEQLAQALAKRSLEALESAFSQYNHAICLAVDNQAFHILQKGIRHCQNAIPFSGLLEKVRAKILTNDFFQLILDHFPPSPSDFGGHVKNTIDMDERMVRSLLHHGHLGNHNVLLRSLSVASSRKAFGLVVDDYLNRMSLVSSIPKQHPGESGLFDQLNSYYPAPRATEALPDSVFAILMRYPTQILEEHLERRQKRTGSTLKLGILQGLYRRSLKDERMMDVVEEIASYSQFKLQEVEHVLWIEQIGIKINPEIAQREILQQDWAKESSTAKAGLYYAFLSDSFPVDDLARLPRLTHYRPDAGALIYVVEKACQTYQANPDGNERFPLKVAVFIKSLLKRFPDVGNKLLTVADLPRQELVKDSEVRDHLLQVDLGI